MPNTAPHSENKNIQAGIKNTRYLGCLAKKKLTFFISVLTAPVRSMTVNSAPTTKINAIISAHWAKPFIGACSAWPMPCGAASTV